MKKLSLSLVALALFTASQAQNLDRSIRPKPGPAPEIKLKDAQTFTLPNGLKVFVVENHKLPVVSYSFQFDIDPAIDQDKAGLDDFIGSLVTAGTKTRTKAQFDEATDKIGATIQASGASVFGSAMKKHQEAMLALLSDALLNADFKQEELDKLKKQAKSGLEQSKVDPDAMLGNVTKVLNYGGNHPYAQIATEATIEQVTLQDAKDYYKTYYRPNVAYLAVVGDITLAEAKTLVAKYFAQWEKAEVPKVAYPKANYASKSSVEFVPRDNAVQSVIGVSYPLDLKPGTPDVVKVRMLNEILGGSGTGRLFMNLREKHGWTYGSYSSIDNDKEVGSFQAYAKARNVVTDSSVNEILGEMRRIREEKVDAKTLQEMKNYVSGTFAIGLENPQTIARYAINIDRYNMPKDYYKNYLKNVNAVTVDDIQQTAQKYIKPDAARIIVVGDKEEAQKLKRFAADGKVNFYDSYGKQIASPFVDNSNDVKAGNATTDKYNYDMPTGEKATPQLILDKYAEAVGGRKAIESIKSIVTEGSFSTQGMDIIMTTKVVSPDKYMMSIVVPTMGEVQRVVVNGNAGKATGGGQEQALSEAMIQAYHEQADFTAPFNAATKGYTATLKPIERVDGKECYVIEKTKGKGDKIVSYYDRASNLLVKEFRSEEGQTQTFYFSDYKAVKNGNGFKAPFTIKLQNDQGIQEITVSKIEVNTTIKESEFK
jgi:zinc protease